MKLQQERYMSIINKKSSIVQCLFVQCLLYVWTSVPIRFCAFNDYSCHDFEPIEHDNRAIFQRDIIIWL